MILSGMRRAGLRYSLFSWLRDTDGKTASQTDSLQSQLKASNKFKMDCYIVPGASLPEVEADAKTTSQAGEQRGGVRGK